MSAEGNPALAKRRRAYRAILIAAVALTLAGLNLIPGSRGSMAFEEQSFDGFAPSRGFPIRAWTFANDDGVELIEASVVMGGVVADKDFGGNREYPHLAYEPTFIGFDVCFALGLLSYTYFLVGAFLKQPRNQDEGE